MAAELKALLGLQEKDQVIQAIEDELARLEPEVETLDREVAEAEAQLEAARNGITQAGDRRQEIEEKIENYKLMQERKRQRLEWVRGAKEASTLMAELELGRGVLAKEEAEWIRSSDHVQEAELKAAEAEKTLQELKEAQAPRREELAQREAEARERLEQARAARKEAARAVPAALRSRYERIRQGRAPQALYPLHASACGHCYTAVPMHRRQEIRNDTQLVMCEACGVLVYDPDAVADGG